MAQANVSPTVEFIDVPGISETFADTVQDLVFDGQTFRIQLCVTRMSEPKGAGEPLTGKRYTACRVVLSPAAALDLSNKLSRVIAAMLKQGTVRKNGQQQPAQVQEQPAQPKAN